MPCVVTQEEVLYYEKEGNLKKFGKAMSDSAVLAEVACSACRTLEDAGKIDKAPVLVQKWWKVHKAEDEAKKKKKR